MSKRTNRKTGHPVLFGAFFLGLNTALIALVLNKVFHGPSRSARNALTMTLLEPSATKWIPPLFLGKQMTEQIRSAGIRKAAGIGEMPDGASEFGREEKVISSDIDWSLYSDGIRIEEYKGRTYNAHIMLVKDPSRLYLALSSYSGFSESLPGKRLHIMMKEEGASAGINAGAFNDDGTAGPHVGAVPAGLIIHEGKICSDCNKEMVPEHGFCGFNKEHKLVAASSMSAEEAKQQGIQEGCEFGPVLIRDKKINSAVYAGNSGYNPRTAIGQRPDGTVILLCVDGRQAGSLGATYKDLTDIMTAYGACNAVNLDGGSSTAMFYHDENGKYGERGQIRMISSYSVMQSIPRRMPTFWMVRPTKGGAYDG